ncbi:hypothetical protein [Helicobacter anatolicus]|uniref:hypothetical protein n=1 Tax=Helicobacter anatolicus TaxID=2905874 RepID=UPI001E2A83A6|nr:hypothetical protein [Helicobacter anatolicus]MCE3039744.1 hypothetical protein [Helicobacter anatolicus]
MLIKNILLIKNSILYIRLWFNLTHQTSRKLDFIDILFIFIAGCSVLLFIFMINELSLSEKEVKNFFNNSSLLFVCSRWLTQYFSQTDLIAKTPLLVLHFFNLMLLYGICRHILKHKSDSLVAIFIYILLPGVNFATLFLIESNQIIFTTLAVGYIITRYKKIPIILLLILSLFSAGTIIVVLGIAVFALRNKHYKTFLFCLLCAGINYFIYDLDINGKPQGYILDTLGQMAMLYSPLLFIYYAYSIYWGIIHKNSPLAYIAGSSIIFCILLSLRQDINFYTLIPQSLIGIPILIQCFFNDLRTHLPQFRTKHYILSSLIIIFLFCETSLFLGNKITYLFSQKPNFASNYYFTKEIAQQLKDMHITAIKTNSSLAMQLEFYGIYKSHTPELLPTKTNNSDITIIYNGRAIKKYNIKNH